ncbi:hypothetical protein RRG08_062356 [Elysia crispata]|uniref:Uncharacterized protein n=1 Tax=Elysia crispata TaxID=231223 RepID=A0AAE1CYY6_9GAST|nr:hypothetical protein RRG08_062356 [Elysia crispata]
MISHNLHNIRKSDACYSFDHLFNLRNQTVTFDLPISSRKPRERALQRSQERPAGEQPSESLPPPVPPRQTQCKTPTQCLNCSPLTAVTHYPSKTARAPFLN